MPSSAPEDGQAPLWQPGSWTPNVEHFKSAPTAKLTSPELAHLRELLCTAETQKAEARSEVAQVKGHISSLEREKWWKGLLPVAWMFKRRLAEVDETLAESGAELGRLESWVDASGAPLDFGLEGVVNEAYDALVAAFEKAAGCDMVWDVMTATAVDQKRERSAASTAIERERVSLGFGHSHWVTFGGQALVLGNRNGQPLAIYPGFVLVDGGDTAGPALIALEDLRVDFEISRFIEEARVPSDAVIVDQTWAKVNKDGSKDKRFKGNYQIPIVAYGRVAITSKTGLNEVYQFSNPVSGLELALTLRSLQLAIRDDGSFQCLVEDMQRAREGSNAVTQMAELLHREYGVRDRRRFQSSTSAGSPRVESPREHAQPRHLGVVGAVGTALTFVALADGKVDAKERRRLRELLTLGTRGQPGEVDAAVADDDVDERRVEHAVATLQAGGVRPDEVFTLACALLGSKRGTKRQELLKMLQQILGVPDRDVDRCWAQAKEKYP